MRLDLAEYPITDVVFGETTSLDGARLVVSESDLREVAAEEEAIERVDLAIARPGDSTRIIHVLDAVEAMVKVEGPGSVYPGFLGPAVTAGRGTTNKLTGFLLVSTTEFPDPMPGGLAFRECIIDMSGPGQPLCQASSTINLVLQYTPAAGASNYALDDAIRRATLRMAERLGEASLERTPASRRSLELGPVSSDLPKVAYIDQIMSQTLMTRTFVYGQELGDSLPTVIHPNELIDGAIVTGNYKNFQKVATYLHCNKPVAMELYQRHGVDVNFVGVVVNRGHRDNQALKERGAQFSAKVAKMLGAEGAVVSFEGGGNATVDHMLTIRACEQLGIRAVGEVCESARVGKGDSPLIFHVAEADALISKGALGARITVPKMERVLGGSPRLDLLDGKVIEDATESFTTTSHDYWGTEWQMGESRYLVREY